MVNLPMVEIGPMSLRRASMGCEVYAGAVLYCHVIFL
jgi:hypothetical protein